MRAIAAIGLLSLGVSIAAFAAPLRTLVDLAREGKRDSIIAAITSPDVDVNVKSPDGATSLMWAINNNDMELARALLKAGAKANVISNYGASALGEAIKHSDLEMVRTLLDAGADVNSPGTDNQTALMLAISVGPPAQKIAELLIQRGADVNAIETFRGQNALMWAAAGNLPDIVDQLIAKGATNLNLRAKADDWDRLVTSEPRAQFGTRYAGGLTALLYATRSGCLRCAQTLVKAGADIEKPNPDGVTPLINALDNSRFDVANFLLDQGANPHTWDMHGRTAIYCAVDRKIAGSGTGAPGRARGARGDAGAGSGGAGARPATGPAVTPMAVINRLLDMHVDVNHQLTRKRPYGEGRARFADYDIRGGVAPLFLAAMNHDHEAMEALIKHGAEVDLVNVFQMTPLMVAAGMRSSVRPSRSGDVVGAAAGERAFKTLDILVAAGANINARVTGSHNRTAVLMAYVAGRDQEGRTALVAAADNGSAAIVAHLLSRGADPALRGTDGKSALDVAREPPPYPEISTNKAQRDLLIAGRAETVPILEAAMKKAGISILPAAPAPVSTPAPATAP